MPENWTLKKLLGKHASEPFNPRIADAFFRAGYIEAWGRGIEKIYRECREHGIEPPVYEIEPTGMMVTFRANPAHIQAPESLPWNRDARRKRPSAARETATRPESRPELQPESQLDSRLESQLGSALAARILLRLARREIGKATLAAALGHKTVSGELNKQVRRLVELNYLAMSIPEKPQSRLQKYRLTPAGAALVASVQNEGASP